MPLAVDDKLPSKFPQPEYLTLQSFERGVISLIDKSRLPQNALETADNIFLVEDGQPSVRPGVDWFGVALPGSVAILGADYFDFSGAIHIVAVGADGVVYRSTDDAASWTACTGATMNTSAEVNLNQFNSYLYLTNGVDNIVRYDGSTTLQTYTALVTPAAPALTTKTGLGGTNITYYYKIAAVNSIGFSAASVKLTQTVDRTRDTWDASNNILLAMPAYAATQLRFDIYLSENDIDYYYLDSVATPNTAWRDDGTAIVVPSTTAPTANTTQGPLVEQLTNVGSRMYGVRDTANKYRIWFSSGSPPVGAFSSAYDGGYLDWAPGGKYIPVKVEDYRDGKGTPLATVFCKSADGQGCVLQMSLDVFTVGDISITVPSAYKLPGSRGTPAPNSVINVLNDYMFYNSQAFYNLGSRAQYLNLLSTDESSGNIRPSVKQISGMAESSIAAAYFDANVYMSVPVGSSTNNRTMIFNTEIKGKPWLPTAFTIGFKRFLRYTSTASDGTKTPRLLAWKPGDSRLSEISKNIRGDYGVAFESVLVTGLYPTEKDRFAYQYTEEAEMEFSNPTGDINVELIGVERQRGFRSLKQASITSQLSTTGWDTFLWDTTLWDDTSVVIDVFSESTVQRYFRVGKELRAVQWRITTNTLDAGYVARTLQTWGTATQGGHPRNEKVTTI